MKRLLVPIALALALILGWSNSVNAEPKAQLDGVWAVDAQNAPYGPHLFSFQDGIVKTTNPTNVQVGSTDSVGMGVYWRVNRVTFEGTFYQENALQPSRAEGPRLAVSFRIKVKGNHFEGPAVVFLGDERQEDAKLVGNRLGGDPRGLRLLPR